MAEVPSVDGPLGGLVGSNFASPLHFHPAHGGLRSRRAALVPIRP